MALLREFPANPEKPPMRELSHVAPEYQRG